MVLLFLLQGLSQNPIVLIYETRSKGHDLCSPTIISSLSCSLIMWI